MPLRLADPGSYVIDAADYHADPAPEPSLSHSIMRALLGQSPRHARFLHPRLCPDPTPRTPTAAMEEGTIMHHLILGASSPPVIVAADDWKKAAARDARDDARAAGRAPILAWRYAELCECAREVTAQLREEPECAAFFARGRSEVTLLWQTGPVWSRALVDRLPNAPGAPMFDLKSTGMSAAPDFFRRTIERDHAMQAVHYLRGGSAVLDVPPLDFRFLVYETRRPYGVACFRPSPNLLETAEAEVRRANVLWARCTILDEWPGYPPGLHDVEPSASAIIKAETDKLQWTMSEAA